MLFWSKNNFWSIGCVFEQWNHFLNLIVILKEENLIFRKTTVFYIKMSCLYADMILDLRKKQHEWIWKTFHWWKAQDRKKNFLSKRASFNKCTEGEFFSYICTLVKLQKKVLKYPLILKTKFYFIFIPSIIFPVRRPTFKKNNWPVFGFGLGNRGLLKVLNDIKLIQNDQRGHSATFRINLKSYNTYSTNI